MGPFFFFLKSFLNPSCPFLLSDTTSTAWQKDSSGNMKRTLNYTVTINNPLIGKFSTATENQVGLQLWKRHKKAKMVELLTAYSFHL